MIANSLKAVAIAAHTVETLRVNELALLEKAFTNAIIGNDTFFPRIHKLLGSECLEINLKNGSMHINPIAYVRYRWDVAQRKIDELAEEFAGLLRSIICDMAGTFSDIRIMSTGGIDNRMLLASLLAVGAKPGLIFVVGDSILTSTMNEDLVVNQIYARRFGLDLHVMDWRTIRGDITRYWDILFSNYGFYMSIYLGSLGFFRELESVIPGTPDHILTGYFGETVRCRPWLEYFEDGDVFSIDKFMDAGWLDGRERVVEQMLGTRYVEQREYVRNKIIQYGDRRGIERDGRFYCTRDFYMLYDSWYRRDADVPVVNLANLFVPSCLPLSYAALHGRSFDIPLSYRKHDRFSLKVTEKLDRRLLDIPFFSHRRWMYLDHATFELRPRISAVSVADKISKFFKKAGLHGNTYQAFRDAWMATLAPAKVRREHVEVKELRKQIGRIVRSEQEKANLKLVDPSACLADIEHLACYGAYLYCINRIMDIP